MIEFKSVGPPFDVSPGAARDTARQILSQREFRPEHSPKPLEGVIRWLRDRIDGIVNAIGDFLAGLFNPLFSILPGAFGTVLGFALCIGIAALVIWLVSRNVVRNQKRAADHPSQNSQVTDDPNELETAAQRAEREQQFDLAIRYRYRAGLIRLDRAGVIDLQPWNTAALLTRRVASPRFDRITDTFEEVTYGGRTANGSQASTVRAEWSTLLTEVSHR